MSIAEKLAERDPSSSEWQRDLSISLNNLGDIEKQKGDLSGAEQSYLAALKIRQTLAKSDPSNSQWQRDLSLSFERLGNIKLKRGDLVSAEQSFHARLEIAQRLAERDPSNSEWQRDLYAAYYHIVLLNQGEDKEKAINELNKAIEVSDKLLQKYPHAPQFVTDSETLYSLKRELVQ
ncbi:hypothetical protein [Pseudoalteromonas byunsanensis]